MDAQGRTSAMVLLLACFLWVPQKMGAGAALPPSPPAQLVTFKVSDGDGIACIPIAEQPSATAGRLVQKAPSSRPVLGNSTNVEFDFVDTAQLLFEKEEPTGCPVGTIPIRAVRLFREPAALSKRNRKAAVSRLLDGMGHQHAYASVEGSFLGVSSVFSVWAPFVADPGGFSLSQLWLVGGYEEEDTNTIEAGWQVFPAHYGDSNPRLFLYWTADGYNRTGCYNLDCPGFVQVSNKVVLGGTIFPASALNGIQYEMKLMVFKDNATGDWWLQFNEEVVGYWPSSLFNHLTTQPLTLQWGGEVYYQSEMPLMGSGDLPTAGFQRAAYHRNLQFVDAAGHLRDADCIAQNAEVPTWYSTYPFTFDVWKSGFFYGGPGLSRADGCGGFALPPSISPAPAPL